MTEFDDYARPLVENPGEAVVYEGIEEETSKFVLSLRGALKRAGVAHSGWKYAGRQTVAAILLASHGPGRLLQALSPYDKH